MSIRLDANAVVGQVAVVLARYGRHMDLLARSWPDMELYARVSAEMDEVRSLALHVPALSIPLCELIISHAELVAALSQRGVGCVGEQLVEVRARHQAVAAGLGARCGALLVAPGNLLPD
jgi:hypothetical protein